MAPLACAAVNAVAVFVLALWLAPGTPVVADLAERERYVREHADLWRVGWSVWMLAAATLVWFYAWWRARVGAPRVALVLAAAGIVADWSSELLLIVAAPTAYADIAPFAFFLTGAIANGLYTVAGVMLTLATRLTTAERVYAAVMWSAGVVLSLGAVASLPLLTAAASAVLFALFCPWCVWLARRFA